MSPLLFLLYIDDLRRVIPVNVEVAMFADDVLLFSSHPNKEVAEAAIQEAITNVAEWSRFRKLTLNTSKCEVTFFTNNSKEARWQPSVQLDGTRQNIYGSPTPPLKVLTTDPERAQALARVTLG